MARKKKQKWSARVMRTSDALDLEGGVFTQKGPAAKDELRRLYGRAPARKSHGKKSRNAKGGRRAA